MKQRGTLPFALLLLSFALRLYHLNFQSIWWDEGHSILMASAPISQIPTLPGMDVHPPGFFATLHLWMGLAGRSEFALRYLLVVFSVLTVTLLIRFGREMGGERVGLWTGLFAALSPFYVAYAQEVRMYAVLTFFATASVYFLWRLLLQTKGQGDKPALSLPNGGTRGQGDKETRRQGDKEKYFSPAHLHTRTPAHLLTCSPALLLGYILTAAIALYTHYFTLFLLAFQNLAWLLWFVIGWRSAVSYQLSAVSGQRSAVKMRLLFWFGTQAGIFLLFAPQIFLAARQIIDYANPNLQPPGLLYYIVHNWQAYTLGLTFDPLKAQPYLWTLLVILLIAWGYKIYSAIERQSSITPSPPHPLTPSLFLLAWLIIPLALYFIVLQQRPSYEPRYMMLVTPSLFLLFGLAFSAKSWLTNLMGLAVAVILVFGLRSYYTAEAFFKDDANSVTEWLAAETAPKDIVYVDVPHPFHYYADRIPAPTRYLFVDIHTAADTLNRESLGKERLYWVAWWGSDTDPRGVIPYLASKQAGPPGGERQFRGYRVEWYNLSDQAFSLPANLLPANVNFDNVLLLDGLAYSESLSLGEAGWATLHFTQLGTTDINYKLSLRLRAPDGRLLAQVDKPILNDRHFQTAAWPIEDPALNQAVNVYTLPLNDLTYIGPLILEAVVYNAQTGDSIAAYGVPTTNDDFVSAQIGEVIVKNEK